MALSRPNWNTIVTQHGLVATSLEKLSPAISNSQLVLKGTSGLLKVTPNQQAARSSGRRGTVLVVRGEVETALVYCWSLTSIVRANSLEVGDYIEVSFPDVRYRNKGLHTFPVTFEYELHIGEGDQAPSAPSGTSANLKAIVLPFSTFNNPLVTYFATLSDVCNEECMKNIVTIGAVLIRLGERKITSGHRNSDSSLVYVTCRLWDTSLSLPTEYINVTLWGSDADSVTGAQIGDSIIFERLCVSKYKSMIQLASTKQTLCHLNPPLAELNALRDDWMRHSATIEIPPNLASFQRMQPEQPLSFAPPQGIKQRRAQTKRKQTHNARITDYFHPASAEPLKASLKATLPQNSENHPPTTNGVRVEEDPTSSVKREMVDLGFPIGGKFSIDDAVKLVDGQSCWTIACVSDILASSMRGVCVYECLACLADVSKCFCSPSCKSFAWRFNATFVFRDADSELCVPLDPLTTSRLLGTEAALFVGWPDEDQKRLIAATVGKAFKILFQRHLGRYLVKQIFEIPLGQFED